MVLRGMSDDCAAGIGLHRAGKDAACQPLAWSHPSGNGVPERPRAAGLIGFSGLSEQTQAIPRRVTVVIAWVRTSNAGHVSANPDRPHRLATS